MPVWFISIFPHIYLIFQIWHYLSCYSLYSFQCQYMFFLVWRPNNFCIFQFWSNHQSYLCLGSGKPSIYSLASWMCHQISYQCFFGDELPCNTTPKNILFFFYWYNSVSYTLYVKVDLISLFPFSNTIGMTFFLH